MPMGIPAGNRIVNRLTQFDSAFEAAGLQRQRAQDLPPRFDQVQTSA
jgi:hypothetical protein